MKKIIYAILIMGSITTLYSCGKKEEKVVAEQSQIKTIEEQIVSKYQKQGVVDVVISEYSKGIDVEIEGRNKELKKDEFKVMAQDAADLVRKDRDITAKVGVAYLYREKSTDNCKTIFSEEF